MQFSMVTLNISGIIAIILVMLLNYQIWLMIKERYRIELQSNLASAALLIANYLLSFVIVFALIGIANRI